MTAPNAKTAGQKLRATFDEALVAAGDNAGCSLTWDEHELEALAAAADAADRYESLDRLFNAELVGEARPGELVRLSAELRLLSKAVIENTSRVKIGAGVAKSERHQRAVNARWKRHYERNA